jgi:hypothetical protein
MELMSERKASRASLLRSRIALWAAGLLLVCGVTAGATGWLGEWWERWTVTTEDLGDGTVQMTITDETGDVAFDQVVPDDSAVFVTEQDDVLVVRPCDDPLLQEVLDEIAQDERAAADSPLDPKETDGRP